MRTILDRVDEILENQEELKRMIEALTPSNHQAEPSKEQPSNNQPALTENQRTILTAAKDGQSYPEIADRMGVSRAYIGKVVRQLKQRQIL